MANDLTPLVPQPGISNDQAFADDVGALLEAVEGVKPSPYLDDKGIPTVGIGVNLHSFVDDYFGELTNMSAEAKAAVGLVLSRTYTKIIGYDSNGKPILGPDDQTFQTALTNAIAPFGGVSSLSLNGDEIEDLYQKVVVGDVDGNNPNGQPALLKKFETFLIRNHISSDMLTSQEGLAIFSLFFNNAGTLLPPTGHLVPDLKEDANGNFTNRADAWFQIRYGSNKGALTVTDPSNGQNGTAIRRDMESTIFGLYDSGDKASNGTITPSFDESLAIYSDFSNNTNGTSGSSSLTNRQFAFSYENRYGALIDSNSGANAKLQGIQPLVAGESLQQLTNLTVQTLEDELQPAAKALIEHYITDTDLNPWVGAGFSADTIDSRDVQVATTAGGSHLVASLREGYQLDTGVPMPSLLIAQGGKDTLDASSSNANDALIGGSGNDIILGGTGDDYIVAGTGNDSITLIGGHDTVVLGDANNPLDGGHDTVDASQDAGSVTYYVGASTHETIKLGSGDSVIELVSSLPGNGVTLRTLSITARWIAPGEWFDEVNDALLVQQPDPSTGLIDPNAGTKDIEVIYGPTSGGSAQAVDGTDQSIAEQKKLSVAQLQQIYAADAGGTNSTSTVIELTLDNFTGSSDEGITLGAPPPAPPPPGSSNLSQLHDEGLVGDTTPGGDAHEVYEDSVAGALVGSIYGTDSSANAFGNEILGDGNASFISAGNGNNTVLLGNFYQHATDPTATALNATVQGGSGNQDLIGVGNGTETITGGAVGTNTSATTFIDGGGATADLVGGGQNSVIFGGSGADTLVASENDGSSGSGFNPTSILMAGISFWGDVYSSVSGASGGDYDVGSLPEVNWSGSPADIQVDLSLFQTNDTYGTPFNLLGSSYDSGSPGSTTLPGSLLIGGTGHDVLIGNSGNDTIIGGNPTDTVSGTTDEILIGGAGANLIYSGNGSEIIYADMGPGDVSGWAALDASDSDTIYGGDGADVIYGSGGNDYLYGGSGIDQIYVGNGSSYVDAGSGMSSVYGGTGNDTIIAGGTSDYVETGDGNSSVSLSAGEATISTGAGSDTIAADSGGGTALITEGTGAVTIMAGVSTGSDTVQLGSGGTTVQLDNELDESTLVVRDVNGDLVLSDGGAMQLTLQSYFADGGNVALQFSDGASWGVAQILQASMTPSSDGSDDTLVGSDGNDSITAGYGNTSIVGVSGNNTLTGGEAADTIDGGSGADTIEGGSVTTQIYGGTGLETYVYNVGDGSDTIWENTTATGNDTITFGAGISASDLSFIYDSSTNDALITVTSTGETLAVSNFVAAQTNQHQIAAIDFADGSSLSQLQVIQQAWAIYGTTGNDDLIGTSSANYFDGKGGDDIEVGDGDNDTFVFNAGYGDLEIYEQYSGSQQPVLQLGSGITAAALHVAENDSDSLVLTDGISGDRITLDDMEFIADTGIATVQLADGTTLTAAQLLQMEIDGGTTGDDTLHGTSGADLFDGKGGNDAVYGNGGNDTFVFNAGYGDLEIFEFDSGSQQPVLQLGAGITASALHVTASGNIGQGNLMLTDGISGDQVTLYLMTPSGNGVALVELADGTTLTAVQLIQMEMTGTTDNDIIYGTQGADLIDGGGGDDVEYGDGGNDTFTFNAGYGGLEINESYTSGQQPVLQLGAEITASALHVTTDGTNLILTDGVSGDRIVMDNMWSSGDYYGYGVTTVQLADGTTLTAPQLVQMEVAGGTTGSDTLHGTSGADLLDGKGGNDVEIGDGGNDTFVFNSGYGELEINESYTSGQQPVLQLGAGITASSLSVIASDNGNSLALRDDVTGDQITLDNMAASSGAGVALVQLADGTTLTDDQLIAMSHEIIGTPGDDTLDGTSGADLIDGQGGNDEVVGNGGNDTFVFNAGYGQLWISESYTNGQQPILQLGSGITESTLRVTLDGTNMILTDGIGGDQVTLGNETWYSNSPYLYGVEGVAFNDGTTLTVAQLLQMEMTGTTNNDTLDGTTNADYFDGMGGDDVEEGGGGNDTFVFNAGYGELEIFENYSNGQEPVLQLGAGITASSLHATADGDNLVLTDGVSGDQVTLANEVTNSGTGVAMVQLGDGTILSSTQLIQMSQMITGTTSNDTLTGTSGADLIDGKGGNDFVIGGGGNDTFIFNAGYGDLEIGEILNGQTSVLQLGPGITASSLHVSVGNDRYASYGSLVLTDGIAGDKVTLDGMWAQYYEPYDGIAEVQLADGTTLTAAQLDQMEMTGTSAADSILGTSGADSIDGKGGNDTAIGSGGNDTFVFNAGYGDLKISENYLSGQHPILQLGSEITASTLQVTADGSGDLILEDGINGDQITLVGMFSDEDNYGVAEVNFADGTTLTSAQLAQMEMTGTAGDDEIYGTSGDDQIDGKGGNDYVNGQGGTDTFIYNAGYGDLGVDESYTTGQAPVLKLGAGITATDLHVTTNGTDLILTDGVNGDQVTLYSMSSTSDYGVATVQLADGTTLTRSQLIQMEMTGTTGNDTITGTTGADLIDGRGGNDSVVGDGGNDTFVFNSSYGHLEINESYTSSQQPVLQLGAGITASTLHVVKSGNNLLLTDGVSGDQITLDTMSSSSTHGVATVQLADGTTLTRTQLIQMETIGTTGNDTITGTSSADLIDGRGGNDSVVGAGGNDTFVFNSGYGHLEINESFTSGQQPIVQLGTGITAASLHVTETSNNLLITDGVSGDQITLDTMWSSTTKGVTSVHLADGTTLTRAQLLQMEMTGTSGNDTLQGTSGADLIDGKGGNDSVTGSGGNDTFVFNSGYGHLAISETFTSGQSPILQMGAGITSATLHVAKSGSNLVLTDGVTGDQVTLNNMSSSSTSGVASVHLADGTILTRAQLIQKETASVVKAPAAPLAWDNGATLQINSLIHAIAGYTGGGGGGMATSMMPPVNSDAMLHAAA